VRSATSGEDRPGFSKTEELRPAVASSTTARPASVIEARTTRRSESRRERAT
jgi:hypothetical protein